MEKYIYLENELKKIINFSKPHTLLPSLNQIMKTYNVSTTTARKALSDLNNQGIIYTVNGKGSFVSPIIKEFPEIYCVCQGIVNKDSFSADTGLFPFLLEELCTILTENEMEMIFSVYKNSLDLERQILKRLPEKKPDGTIIYATGKKELLPWYKKVVEMIPNTVFVDRYVEGVKTNYVGTDNYEATKQITEKIACIPFDKIYFVETENPTVNVLEDRKRGFEEVIKNTSGKSVFIKNNNNNYNDFMEKVFCYFNNDLKKHKRVCIFGQNSIVTQEIYINCLCEIKNLELCQLVSFEKPNIIPIPNVRILWAKQKIRDIAEACVNIIKSNEKKKKTVLFPVDIISE